MMARSTRGSNQRPDTLMQDRTSANSMKVLLQRTAGPYIWVNSVGDRRRHTAAHVRFAPESEHGSGSFPPSTLGECRHRGLARRRVDGDSFHTKAPASPWRFLLLAPPKYRVHSGVALSEERTVSLILYYLAF